MKLQIVKLTALGVFAAASIGCGAPAAPNQAVAPNAATAANAASPQPPATEVASAKSGKELYVVNCLNCHGAFGKGGKVTVDGKSLDPDDLTSERMKAKTDEKLYGYISDGIVDEGMPAFKDTLKPDEIKAVVAHMRELQSR